ncbi:MAG TPA: YiiX/YebB-like N1pC/P60 family cysteine hydrolase [Pirellulaceae bacterium]|nr:YiiX/YebB-like N1pC/P60 family cysteine hydrolase [Pirellulaceae bacterium]
MRGNVPQPEPNPLASFSDTALRSIDDSLLLMMRGDRVLAWDDWARANVRDGDIVFLQSRSNWMWGFIELSRVTQDITASSYTHVALAAIEDGNVVLYDIDTPGPGRTPFGKMMADSQTAALAVKRLRPEFQPYVPKAIQYCREVYAARLPFDKQLSLDNDQLYCAELIEVAFRYSGLELSQPTRWKDLPGLDKHPIAVSTIAWVNNTQPSESVVVPGNEQIGIWASPGLELVLPLTDARQPPTENGLRESQPTERELQSIE